MPRRTSPRPDEPLWYLKVIPYTEYRQSAWWVTRRRAFRDMRAELGLDRECDLCGSFWNLVPVDFEFPRWHVHHLSYERLGEERDSDLAYLCSPCHHLVHFPSAQQSQAWLENPYLPGDLAERAAAFRPVWGEAYSVETEEIPF